LDTASNPQTLIDANMTALIPMPTMSVPQYSPPSTPSFDDLNEEDGREAQGMLRKGLKTLYEAVAERLTRKTGRVITTLQVARQLPLIPDVFNMDWES
jgi:hypothetical protein